MSDKTISTTSLTRRDFLAVFAAPLLARRDGGAAPFNALGERIGEVTAFFFRTPRKQAEVIVESIGRGALTILDKAGLSAATCVGYQLLLAEHEHFSNA